MKILHIVDYIGPHGGLYQVLCVLNEQLKRFDIDSYHLALVDTPYQLDQTLVTLPMDTLRSGDDFFRYIDELRPDIIHLHSDLKNEYFEYCIQNYITARSIFDWGPFCPKPMFDNAFCPKDPLFQKTHHDQFIKANCIPNQCIIEDDIGLFKEKMQVLKRVDALVCLSQACAEYSERMGVSKEKIFKMPPIMEAPQERKPPVEDNIILFAGRMVYHKGTKQFLESLVKLKTQNYKVILEGTGEKEFVAELVRFAIVNGIEDKIEIIGHNTYQEYLEMFYKVKLLVFPSVYAEGFGYPAYEAMLRGVPIIAFEGIGGDREWLKHDYNGISVPFKDIDGLAQAIDTLLTDEALYHTYRQNSMEWSSRVDFRKEIEEMKNFYCSLKKDKEEKVKNG